MSTIEDQFVAFLQPYRGKKVYLKPYWGNSGDVLIWMGIEIIMERIGFCRVLDPKEAEIILWPGGNPTMWSSNLECWKECWSKWPDAQFIVAPATFQGDAWQDVLRNAPRSVIGVFARDPQSYQHLKEAHLSTGIQIGLAHDPAFHLRDSDWIKQRKSACATEYVLACFRGDHESCYIPPAATGISTVWPISSIAVRREQRRRKKFQQYQMSKVRAATRTKDPILERDAPMMSFEAFAECVQRASEIHTDRLHCMIIGALLGKPVFAYPTAYGKLEAVYDYSMKDWAKVDFIRL